LKVTISRESLLAGLTLARAVAPKKEGISADIVNLSADMDSFYVQACDLETSVMYTAPSSGVDVVSGGSLVLPVALTYDLVVNARKGQEIEITSQETNAQFRFGKRGRVVVYGQSPDVFPDLPEFQPKGCFSISREDLSELIEKSIFAGTSDESKYDLDNVYVKARSNSVSFIATDGKRLAICTKQTPTPKKKQEAVVPRSGLRQVAKLVKIANIEEDEAVEVAVVGNHFVFNTEHITLAVGTVTSQFPPYEKLLNSVWGPEARIDANDLISPLKQIAALSGKAMDRFAEFTFSSPPAGKLQLSSTNSRGKAEYEMQAAMGDMVPLPVKFDPDLLLPALAFAEDKFVWRWTTDANGPSLMEIGSDFRYIVLPIKTDDGV